MRLLLIEDHAPLRDAIGQYLTEAGYLVDTASTGDEGLWAKQNPVHIIVISARDGL